jgi:hypothetical protein
LGGGFHRLGDLHRPRNQLSETSPARLTPTEPSAGHAGRTRFEDATGSASVVAPFETDGVTATIAVVVEGTIDY